MKTALYFSFNHSIVKQSQICHRLARSNAEVPSTLSPSGLDQQKVEKATLLRVKLQEAKVLPHS